VILLIEFVVQHLNQNNKEGLCSCDRNWLWLVYLWNCALGCINIGVLNRARADSPGRIGVMIILDNYFKK